MMGNDWSAVGMGLGGTSTVLIWAAVILAIAGLVWPLRSVCSRPACVKSDQSSHDEETDND